MVEQLSSGFMCEGKVIKNILIHKVVIERIRPVVICEDKFMTLKDTSNGPAWIIWIVGILFAIISIILISGRGANLIAG